VAINNIIESFGSVAKTADGMGSQTQPDIVPQAEQLQPATPSNGAIPSAETVQPNATINDNTINMKNPTGGGIRKDGQGSGLYGAPRTGNSGGHGGVDLLGSKVKAAHSGYLEVLNRTGYDTGVRITQTAGGNTYTTVYQHIDIVVSQGYIRRNTFLGTIIPHPTNAGITPHLHFEVYMNGIRVNPVHYINIP
jgi:murein DD-endopeptidase MepM/ murein hydrolase activator NlpD